MRVKCKNVLQPPLPSKLGCKSDKTIRCAINTAVLEFLYLTLCTTEMVKPMCNGTHSYLPKFANVTPPDECKITHDVTIQKKSSAQKQICMGTFLDH